MIRRLVGISNSEVEIIKNWCFRIKYLFTKIRASFKQLEKDHLETLIYDDGNPEIKFEGKEGMKKKQWLLMSHKKKTLRRERDVIMQKISQNEELSKKERKLINAEMTSHMWYHCPKLTKCMNRHCLMANRSQLCTSCKQKTKHCECAKQMKIVPCEECEKPYTECKCGLKPDLNIKEVLEELLKEYKEFQKEYKDDDEVNKMDIKSISQLTSCLLYTSPSPRDS